MVYFESVNLIGSLIVFYLLIDSAHHAQCLKPLNRTFYSCLLSDLAFGWQRGWS